MRYEWQKLRKSKLRLGILISLCILPFFIVAFGYTSFFHDFRFPELEHIYVEEDGFAALRDQRVEEIVIGGERYKGLDAIRFIDGIAHEYAGTLESGANIVRAAQFEEKRKELQGSEDIIDEEKMAAYYDENWKSYYERCLQGELTRGEYAAYNAEHVASVFTPEEQSEVLVPEIFQTFYKDEYDLALQSLELAYQPYNNEPYQAEDYLITRDKLKYLEEKARLEAEYPNERIEMKGEYPRLFYISTDMWEMSEEEIDYLNAEFMKHPKEMDGMMAYEFMISCMETLATFFPVILFLFAVLFASLFNQEYIYKTDQLLRPMLIGNKKQAVSKVALCFVLMMGFIVFTLLLIWLIPQVLIGYHSLSGHNIWIWNYLEEMIMITLLSAGGILLYAGIFCCLSSITKSTLSYMLLALVSIIIGCLGQFTDSVNVSFLSNLPSTCFQYRYYPDTLFQIMDMFIQKGYVLLAVYALIAFLGAYIAYQYYRKRGIKNA